MRRALISAGLAALTLSACGHVKIDPAPEPCAPHDQTLRCEQQRKVEQPVCPTDPKRCEDWRRENNWDDG